MDVIKLVYHREVINTGQGKPEDWKRDSRSAVGYIT